MSLFTDDFLDATEKRKPTVSQYIKARKGKVPSKKFRVVKIWTPNKYPSYGIETEEFRANVGKDTTLGKLLYENWFELLESVTDTLLVLQQTEGRKLQYRLEKGKSKGYWVSIGQNEPLGAEWKTD